jgi:hypothetical protein
MTKIAFVSRDALARCRPRGKHAGSFEAEGATANSAVGGREQETVVLHVARETKVGVMELVIREHSDETEAQARLRVGDLELAGWGRARRNPHDPDRRHVGEQLAVARALSDLSHQLIGVAVSEIAESEGSAGWYAEPTERHEPRVFDGAPIARDLVPRSARAGWYPDPDDRYEQRYFDGQAWTTRTRTAGPIQSPS